MDLYHIPGDKGENWRQKKFLEYAIGAPTVCHPTILTYAKENKWGKDEIVTAAFLHCLFYEELTAIYGVDKFSTDLNSACRFWKSHTPHTNPDKRRVITMNLYPEAIQSWLSITEGKPHEWVSQFSTRKDLRKGILRVKNIGGFSADLFENCIYAAGYPLDTRYPEWKTTPQLAIGMCHVLYMDNRANKFRSGKSITSKDESHLYTHFKELCKAMEEEYPGNPPDRWYTKLCSWANLFRGTRYGGYHHDRQLENLHWYEIHFPDGKVIWKRVYKIRRHLWKHQMLGEINGWSGIRPERKKLWLKEGLTGVETESSRKHKGL